MCKPSRIGSIGKSSEFCADPAAVTLQQWGRAVDLESAVHAVITGEEEVFLQKRLDSRQEVWAEAKLFHDTRGWSSVVEVTWGELIYNR